MPFESIVSTDAEKIYKKNITKKTSQTFYGQVFTLVFASLETIAQNVDYKYMNGIDLLSDNVLCGLWLMEIP